MSLTVDKFGRIVLPKPLRERLHLVPGTGLTIEELPDGLVLRTIRKQPSLIRQHGLLVHTGKANRPIDWNRVVEDAREEDIADDMSDATRALDSTQP